MTFCAPPHLRLIHSAGLAVSILVTGLSGRAEASACPGLASTVLCNSPGAEICQLSGNTIICDMTRVGDSSAATVTAVYGYNGSSWLCTSNKEYCVWGTEGTGASFCCEYDISASESSLLVIGTSQADTISLQYTSGSSWDMKHHTTAYFQGKVLGNAGVDTITGSRTNNVTYYIDDLKGDGGDDDIDADVGNDYVEGGAGADVIVGGPGDDIILGGDNVDTIDGEAGDDTIYGNDGDDIIAGDIGVDTLRGDAGADTLCGDDGDDDLFGGVDADTLWGGGGSSDDADGGAPSSAPGDNCDLVSGGSGTVETCTNSESTSTFARPAACP